MFCSGQTVCQCVGQSVNQSFRKISQSVVCLVSTGWLTSVEQGSPFIEFIHDSKWLTSTVLFVCQPPSRATGHHNWLVSSSGQMHETATDMTTCQSIWPDKQAGHEVLWAIEATRKSEHINHNRRVCGWAAKIHQQLKSLDLKTKWHNVPELQKNYRHYFSCVILVIHLENILTTLINENPK